MKHISIKHWRFLPAVLAYRSCDTSLQNMIDNDIYRYLKWFPELTNKSKYQRLIYGLQSYVEYRNVFYFRIQPHCRWLGICKRFLKPADGVEIGGDIAEGLYISHRHAVVFPQKAGKNLRIGPGVVIGKNGGKRPQIGNNVYIASNSTVVGGIHIGDNVIIGAGSVVTKDIPSDVIYAGNPARFIRRMDQSPELYKEIQ